MSTATEIENFSDRSLEALIEYSDVGKSSFGRQLIKAVGNQFYQSWPERIRWLKSFSVWVSPEVASGVVTLVEWRNSIAHGAGSLTKLQTRDLAKQMTLESDLVRLLDVSVDGKLTYPGDRTVGSVIAVGRKYVQELEGNIELNYPELHDSPVS
jgi:hypothetical protein